MSTQGVVAVAALVQRSNNMKIVINKFGGVVPRYIDSAINENMASHAYNVKLNNGALEPFRYPALVERTDLESIKTLHRAYCKWFCFDSPCVDVANWLPTCQRVYATGVEEYPIVTAVADDVPSKWTRVGLPVPDVAISVRRLSTEPIEEHVSTTRSYVFTYVDSFDYEGAPSLPSNEIVANENDEVELSLPKHLLDDSWDIKAIRIYRTAASFIDGQKAGDNVAEEYFFVDEVPLSTAVYVDKKTSDLLCEPLESYQYTPPPNGLRNIIALPDGVLAGSVGNQIWFSEPYNPQAWPINYMLALDDNVIDLKVCAGAVFALTDGHPYAISLSTQDQTDLRQVRRFEKAAPIVSKKSSVAMHNGVIYACPDGLMLLSPNNMTLLTSPWYSYDDWQALLPHTMIGAIVQGQYLGITSKTGFLFDTRDGIENDGMSYNDLMPINLTPNALFTDRDGILYLAFGGIIHRWDAGDSFMPYCWRSKLMHLGGLTTLSSAKVTLTDYPFPHKTSEPVDVCFTTDKRGYFKRLVSTSLAFRLPSNSRYMSVDVCVKGTQSVEQIELASSMNELSTI